MINLMNHINSDRDNPFLSLAFSGSDELMAYLSNSSLDVLLVDEKIYVDIWQEIREQRVLILTRERTEENIDRCGETPGILFKYSKVSDIVQMLMRYMNVDIPERSRQLFRSYGVISPIGRCGKTNLAINICMDDEVRGGLYIGLEDFSSFNDSEDVISNVIYLIKERSSGFIEYVGNHVVKLDDYSVLGYMQSYLEALELTGKDVEWMVEQLKEWGMYTTVVLDIGQAVLKDLSVLSALDVIVVPELSDEQSQEKIKTFERVLEMAELGKVAKRMKKVKVPNSAPGSPEMIRFIESQVFDK